MKKHILLVMFILQIAILCLSGCQKEDSVDNYISSMNEYIAQIDEVGSDISAINPEDNLAPGVFIGYIDQMNQILIQMSALTPPDGYETLGNLASSASSSMTAASGFYVQAYSPEGYDLLLGKEARIKYETALEYVNIMGKILLGQDPSTEEISIVY